MESSERTIAVVADWVRWIPKTPATVAAVYSYLDAHFPLS